MKVIANFSQFVKQQNFPSIDSLIEAYNFKNLQPGSIRYEHLYQYIHDKMWRIATDLVYGKDYKGSPTDNDITIKTGNSTMPAPELFYVLWANIDQYTSPNKIERENLEGKMYHLSDGATRDYRKADWYIQMQLEKSINAGYYTKGYLGDLVEDIVDNLNKFPGNDLVFSQDIKKYNLEKPVNVRRLIRNGELFNILKFEQDYGMVSEKVNLLLNKKKVIEEFKKRTSEGIMENPAFGLEDYTEAIANCRGYLQMKLNQPSMTPQTIGWNILHYINNYIYEFALHYMSINISEQVKGYK